MPATHTSASVVGVLGLASTFVAPGAPVLQIARPQLLVDRSFGGLGKIVGTVHVKGVPNVAVRRRVRLLRDRDAICVGETWSDPTTGAYLFVGVDPTEKYTALAYDYERNYRGVVADNLTPDPYP